MVHLLGVFDDDVLAEWEASCEDAEAERQSLWVKSDVMLEGERERKRRGVFTKHGRQHETHASIQLHKSLSFEWANDRKASFVPFSYIGQSVEHIISANAII